MRDGINRILERYREWKTEDIKRLPSPKELSISELGILTLVLRERRAEIEEAIKEVVEALNNKRREPLFHEELMEKVRSCSTLHLLTMPYGVKISCNTKKDGKWESLNVITGGRSSAEEITLLYKLLSYLKLLEEEPVLV